MPEQFNVFFRQVFVTGQFLILVTPLAAFLIVWGLDSRVTISANLVRGFLDREPRCRWIDFYSDVTATVGGQRCTATENLFIFDRELI